MTKDEAAPARLRANGAYGTTYEYWQEFRCFKCGAEREGKLLAADLTDEDAKAAVEAHFAWHDQMNQRGR